MFFAFFAQKIFWKPKPIGHRLRCNKLSVLEEQCAAVCEAETRCAAGRRNSTERVTEGEQGGNSEEWRSYRNLRRLGRLQDALQKTANDPILRLAAIQATTNQRVQCTHTKPHSFCSPPSNRARYGRLRRRYTAALIRCWHGKRLRNAPHGSTADPARHRWVASATGVSFRCIRISWTAAMRSPIQRMTGTAIELPSAL